MRRNLIRVSQSTDHVCRQRLVNLFRIRQIQVVHNLNEVFFGLRESWVQSAFLQYRAAPKSGRQERAPKQHVDERHWELTMR